MLMSVGVQFWLNRQFRTWSKVENSSGLTGEEVADELFEEIDDGIVIIDRKGDMQRANRKANQLMEKPESRARLEAAISKAEMKQTLSLPDTTGTNGTRMISVSVSDAATARPR